MCDTTINCDQLVQAVADLAASVDDMYPGEHLTCREADALALLLKIAGHRQAALDVIANHAASDEEEEAHYVQDPDPFASVEDAHEAYALYFLYGERAGDPS